jgi:hypothetical protein
MNPRVGAVLHDAKGAVPDGLSGVTCSDSTALVEFGGFPKKEHRPGANPDQG